MKKPYDIIVEHGIIEEIDFLVRKDVVSAIIEAMEEYAESVHVSRTLSAVPNEDEIDKWYVDSVGLIKRGGNYVWNYSLGYQTHGDQVNMLYDFANWIKQRGIAE